MQGLFSLITRSLQTTDVLHCAATYNNGRRSQMSLENFPSFLLNFSEFEMNAEEKHFYRFKAFRLDVAERQLLHHNMPVSLTPKAFDVLAVLVERSGHLVEKDELLRLVWSDSFVEEANVARVVHTLRKTLGEDENGNKFIETVAKKGYRFVAKVSEIREPAARRSENGKQDPSTIDEKFSETEVQTPPSVTDQTIAPLVSKPKQTARIVLFTVGFMSAVFLILSLSFNFQSGFSFNPNDVKSIAVLPLKPLTAENREPIYEFGIADALIFKLSSAKNLVVRPLSATRRYADLEQDAAVAGREQKVDYVLASNYQIADGKILVTSQLINVQSGQVEEVFKDLRENANKLAVQEAVAANIGQSLLKTLNRKSNNFSAKRYTTNEEAYRLYLQGTALADKRSQKDEAKAIEYFEKAIELDPNYALAYAGLANAHNAVAIFKGIDTHDEYLKAKAAVEKALAIDENLSEAHSYVGEMKMNYEWDFAGAEVEMKKGIELDPNSSNAHRMYALYLNSMGRFDESIAEIKTAIDLEPASVLNQSIYGMILYFARRYDEAIVQLERTIEMDPSLKRSYRWLMKSYQMKGNDEKAFEWFLRSPKIKADNPEKITMWKETYAKSGWRGITQQQIKEEKENEKKGKDISWELMVFFAELGDKEQAIFYMEKVFSSDERSWGKISMTIDPRYDFLRSDPRFKEVIKRIGLK